METPYLNDKINELEIHLRNDELSTLGKEHLTEFKNIKEQLALCSVIGQSEQLSLCQCDKPSPDIMYGKTCTECCLEINPKA